nr:hypothetical protein [Tanacetum cinerariifolium]
MDAGLYPENICEFRKVLVLLCRGSENMWIVVVAVTMVFLVVVIAVVIDLMVVIKAIPSDNVDDFGDVSDDVINDGGGLD